MGWPRVREHGGRVVCARRVVEAAQHQERVCPCVMCRCWLRVSLLFFSSCRSTCRSLWQWMRASSRRCSFRCCLVFCPVCKQVSCCPRHLFPYEFQFFNKKRMRDILNLEKSNHVFDSFLIESIKEQPLVEKNGPQVPPLFSTKSQSLYEEPISQHISLVTVILPSESFLPVQTFLENFLSTRIQRFMIF